MASGRADGSIIINTKILESGFNKGLSSMKNKLSGFGRAVEGSMSSMDSSLGRTAEKVQRIGKLIAGAFAIGKLIQFGKEAVQLGSDLAEMENVTGTVFPHMTKEINEWSDAALDNYGLTRTMAKNYVGTFGAMSKAFGSSERKAFEMSTALAGLSGDVASFYNLSQDEAFTKLKSVFTGETESLKSLGVVMTQTALDQYALANGFGKTVANMTEAEKVELRLAFVTDKLNAASGDFAKTADSWANQTKRLSANFQELKATIGQGLINLFTPVIKGINTLLSYLHTAAKAFNVFTATLMGKKSTGGGGGAVAASSAASDAMSGVADSAGGVADSTSDAADATNDYASAQKAAQKAANGYLSTLDEVNRYTTQQAADVGNGSSPTSGKGGSSPTSGSSGVPAQIEQIYDDSAFAVEDIAEEFSEFAQKLREAFEKGDWEGLGRIIGQKINEVLGIIKEKISWDNVGPYITKFVDAFTRTFNSLVGTINWHLLGETIATGMNTLIYTLQLLITGINWHLLGMSFAQGANGIIDELDWEALGSLLGERFMIPWRMFRDFVFNLEWDELGKNVQSGLSSALDRIDTDEINLAMSGFGIGLALFLNELISPDLFGEVGTKVSEGLNAQLAFLDEFGTHFDFDNFGNSIAEGINAVFINYDFEKLGHVLALFAKNILRSLNATAARISWQNIGSNIASGINKFFEEFQFTDLSETANTFLEGILGGIIELGADIHWEDIGDNIGTGVETFLWDFDALTELATALRIFSNGIFSALTAFFLKINFGSLLEIVKAKFNEALPELNFSQIGTDIINAIWTALNGNDMTEEQKANVLSSFSELEGALTTIANYTFDSITDFYNNVLVPLGRWLLGEGLPELARIIANTLAKIDWEALKTGFGDLQTALEPFAETIGEGLITFLGGLGDLLGLGLSFTTTVFGKAVGILATALSNIPSSGLLEPLGGAIGGIVTAIIAFKGYETVKDIISGLTGVLPGFFTMLASNPVLLAAVGVGALGGALAVFFSQFTKDELTKKVEAVDTALSNISSTLSGNGLAETANYQAISGILDDFESLNDKLIGGEDLTSEERKQFQTYLGILQHYAPKISEKIDTVTGAYTGTREELENLINKQYEQAMTSLYSTAIAEYGAAYNEAASNIKEASEKISAYLIENGADAQTASHILQFVSTVGEDARRALVQTWEDSGESLTAFWGLLNDAKINEQFINIIDSTEQMVTAQENINNTTASQQAFIDMMKNGSVEISDIVSFIAAQFSGIEYSAEEFANGTEDAADRVNASADEMKRGISDATDEISSDFDSHEEDGSTFVRRLFGFASDSARGEGHVFTNVVGEILKGNKENLDEHSEDGKPYGNSMIGSIITGVKGKWESLKEGMRDTAKEASNAYTSEMGIENGTSSVMEDAGESTVTGISTGSEDKKSGLLKIFEELPDEMMGMMGDLMEEFKFPGRIIISGIRRGILNNKQSLFDDIANLTPKMAEQLSGLNAVMWSIGHNAAKYLANGFRSVHIPSPQFSVGTQWSNVAGTLFPVPSVGVTWMASGGVIPKNASRFIAGLGDNNHETEVVSPISTMKQAFSEALLEAGISGSSGRTTSVKVQINRRTIYEEMMAEARERMDRTGINPFELGTT